jgi:L-cysteine/cystine lyase
MQPDPKVKLARDGIPLAEERTYLDTASVGPVSKIYAATLADRTDDDLRAGRAQAARFERIDQAKARIRSEIAALLSVAPETLELTQGTTCGIRAIVDRFPWEPGDEIVTTQLEFPRCIEPLREIARKKNLSLRIADVPTNDTGSIDWLERCVTTQTRLIVFSGVTYATGQRLPIDRIAEFARLKRIHTLIDGAQLIGAFALDLSRTPVDFLAMPLQKWLGGPEGLGALYVRAGSLDLLRQDGAVHGWPVLEATVAHLAWLQNRLGWPWIHERTQELSGYARRAIEALDDDRLMTPANFAGIVATRSMDTNPQQLFDRLSADGITVRYRPEMALFRISTAFFNREDEIDRFVSAIR